MRSRIGLKTVVLCALLVGVMAISASGAQAATPEWMNGHGENLSGEPAISGSLENADATLLTKINGLDIDILCTVGNFVGVNLKALGTTSVGTVKFTGCKIYELTLNAKEEVTGKIELACNVKSTGAPNVGEIVTKEGHGQLELQESVPVTLVVPQTGEEFARIHTEGCVLPETIPVIGKLALKDCENKAEIEQATHLVVEGPGSGLFVINTTNMEHLAKLDGSANVSLTGGGNFDGLAG